MADSSSRGLPVRWSHPSSPRRKPGPTISATRAASPFIRPRPPRAATAQGDVPRYCGQHQLNGLSENGVGLPKWRTGAPKPPSSLPQSCSVWTAPKRGGATGCAAPKRGDELAVEQAPTAAASVNAAAIAKHRLLMCKSFHRESLRSAAALLGCCSEGWRSSASRRSPRRSLSSAARLGSRQRDGARRWLASHAGDRRPRARARKREEIA